MTYNSKYGAMTASNSEFFVNKKIKIESTSDAANKLTIAIKTSPESIEEIEETIVNNEEETAGMNERENNAKPSNDETKISGFSIVSSLESTST